LHRTNQTENSALENRTSGSFFTVSEVKYEGDKIQQTAWGPNQLCYRIKPSLEPMGSLFFIVNLLYASSVVTEIQKTVLSLEMETSSNRFDFVQVFHNLQYLYIAFILQFVHPDLTVKT
jgi:hypothetical protein